MNFYYFVLPNNSSVLCKFLIPSRMLENHSYSAVNAEILSKDVIEVCCTTFFNMTKGFP